MNHFRKIILPKCTKEIINLWRSTTVKTKIVTPQTRFLNKQKSPKATIKYIVFSGIFLSSLLKCLQNDETKATTTEEDNESKIYKILLQSKQLIETEQFEIAKIMLHEALELTNSSQNFSNVSIIFDLLFAIAVLEGNFIAAEDMLVRFIEQLYQIGFSDTDNKIVSYKLKLCRLYEMAGNTEMAQMGYQSCVNTQEKKIRVCDVPSDTETHLLYLSSLFWYGRLLTHRNELQKAKECMNKALDHDYRHSNMPILRPAQRMVLLYHSAEIVFKMEEYENAAKYLMQAIDIGKKSETENIEMPLYVVKLGVVYLYMNMFTQARNWCEMGKQMAEIYQNEVAAIEADRCLKRLREDKVISDDATTVIF